MFSDYLLFSSSTFVEVLRRQTSRKSLITHVILVGIEVF